MWFFYVDFRNEVWYNCTGIYLDFKSNLKVNNFKGDTKMNNKKRVLAFLLALVMIFSCLCTSSFHTCSESRIRSNTTSQCHLINTIFLCCLQGAVYQHIYYSCLKRSRYISSVYFFPYLLCMMQIV